MKIRKLDFLDYLVHALTVLFVLDRLLKLATILHFFQRKPASSQATPREWPSISLIQPVTHGVQGLISNLRSRAHLSYAGTIQHLLICDADDLPTQAVCRAYLAEFPE